MNNDAKAAKVNEALKAFLSDSLAGAIINGPSPKCSRETPPQQAVEEKSCAVNIPDVVEQQQNGETLPSAPEVPKKRRFLEGPSNREKRARSAGELVADPNSHNEEQVVEGCDSHAAPLDAVAEAVARARESIRHLGEYDSNNKDTYEDAIESGGTIEGGTWEHRKRGKEMVNTAQISQIINEMNKNHRSVGNALPPEAMSVLLESQNISSDPAVEGSCDHKLDSKNKGFQLLQKAGWTDGEGLGKTGSGIKVPISAKETKVIEAAEDSSEADDEFAAYRRRMMAYRFRPNPLNNPRRSYDGYKTIYDSTDLKKVIQNVSNENTNT